VLFGLQGAPRRTAADPGAARRAAAHLREQLQAGPVPPDRFSAYAKVARNAGEVSLARAVLDQWERRAPEDCEMLALRAEVEFQAGSFSKSLQLARAVLRRQKDNRPMKDLESRARQQLEDLLKPSK
jgi:hypothetical protein